MIKGGIRAPRVRRTTAAFLGTVSAAALAVAGCSSSSGGGGSLANLTVDLSFPYAASQWNCIYDYGKTKGFYARYGVDPKFDAVVGSAALINEVGAGKVDIGVSAAVANVIQGVSQGAPVKLIAVQERNSPNAVISLAGDPINKPSDLVGKRIAYSPTSLNGIAFGLLLKANGIPSSAVKVVGLQPAGYASALESGAIDGYVSYPSSSVPNQEHLGGQPVVMMLRDFGVNPVPADGYITSDAMIKNHAKQVTGFLEGARDTWAYLFAHQDEATQAGAACAKEHVGVVAATSAKQIQLVLQANSEQLRDAKFMSIDPSGIQDQMTMLQQAGQLSNPKPVTDYYTTTLLPADQ